MNHLKKMKKKRRKMKRTKHIRKKNLHRRILQTKTIHTSSNQPNWGTVMPVSKMMMMMSLRDEKRRGLGSKQHLTKEPEGAKGEEERDQPRKLRSRRSSVQISTPE